MKGGTYCHTYSNGDSVLIFKTQGDRLVLASESLCFSVSEEDLDVTRCMNLCIISFFCKYIHIYTHKHKQLMCLVLKSMH